MATVKINEKEIEVSNGEQIKEACMDLGVPFGCEEGFCGTCRIKVVEGYENLSEITPREKDLFVEGNERQACQCRIKSGAVRIVF